MIKGLTIHKNVFPFSCESGSDPCQKCYMKIIDTYKWSEDLKRRTQHYGARYDYSTKKLMYDVAEFPPLVQNFATYLKPIMEPSQCIINEYLTAQNISAHIDAKFFGPKIVTISLGDNMTMVMTRNKEKHSFVLEGGDLVILEDEARYEWKHELLAVNKPSFRRVSLTFRTIN